VKLSGRQLLDVRDMVNSIEFAYLVHFVKERTKVCEVNARDLAGNLASLLEREQQLGAGYNLQTLISDFSTLVEQQIKQSQDNGEMTNE
jgi:hypothetical protein